MKREEAYPACRVDGVLVRVVAVSGDLVWDIVDGDDAIEESDAHEHQQAKGEVVQKRIEIQAACEQQQQANEQDAGGHHSSHNPLAQPKSGFAKSPNVVSEHILSLLLKRDAYTMQA
jgi:hypothetical protein